MFTFHDQNHDGGCCTGNTPPLWPQYASQLPACLALLKKNTEGIMFPERGLRLGPKASNCPDIRDAVDSTVESSTNCSQCRNFPGKDKVWLIATSTTPAVAGTSSGVTANHEGNRQALFGFREPIPIKACWYSCESTRNKAKKTDKSYGQR